MMSTLSRASVRWFDWLDARSAIRSSLPSPIRAAESQAQTAQCRMTFEIPIDRRLYAAGSFIQDFRSPSAPETLPAFVLPVHLPTGILQYRAFKM